LLHAAVQEERQRAKERNENEVESTSCANEDMPVEKILEAERAVEPKTETYIETNIGAPSNSVSLRFCTNQILSLPCRCEQFSCVLKPLFYVIDLTGTYSVWKKNVMPY